MANGDILVRPLILAAAIAAASCNLARAGECKTAPAVPQPPKTKTAAAPSLPDSLLAFSVFEPPNNAIQINAQTATFSSSNSVARTGGTAAAGLKDRPSAGPETNPAILAVKAGDAKALIALIAQGADVRNVRNQQGRSVALVAMAIEVWIDRLRADAAAGSHAYDALAYPAMVKALVAAGADVSATGAQAKTPLATIAFASEFSGAPAMLAMAAFLLEHGAVLSQKNGIPLVGYVAGHSAPALLEVMLRSGRPSQADKDLALAYAVENRRFPAALVALKAGASAHLNPALKMPCCARSWADALGLTGGTGKREFLKAIIDRKVDSEYTVSNAMPLLIVVMHDHELMEALLQRGVSPNRPGMHGETALHAAMSGPVSAAGRARSVALLLKYGAIPTSSPALGGMTPLMMSTNEDKAAIDLLLNAGDRIDTSTHQAVTPNVGDPAGGQIHWAAIKGNDTLGAALAARITAQDADYRGAVYYAASAGLPATLNALLDKARGRIDVRDWVGNTPLTAAAQRGHASTVAALLDRGAADIDEASSHPNARMPLISYVPIRRPANRRTALMRASEEGHADVVALLLSRGADPDRKDADGKRAIDLVRLGPGHEARDRIIAMLECAKPDRKWRWPGR